MRIFEKYDIFWLVLMDSFRGFLEDYNYCSIWHRSMQFFIIVNRKTSTNALACFQVKILEENFSIPRCVKIHFCP
jgi:hypothetical protein